MNGARKERAILHHDPSAAGRVTGRDGFGDGVRAISRAIPLGAELGDGKIARWKSRRLDAGQNGGHGIPSNRAGV